MKAKYRRETFPRISCQVNKTDQKTIIGWISYIQIPNAIQFDAFLFCELHDSRLFQNKSIVLSNRNIILIKTDSAIVSSGCCGAGERGGADGT